MTTPAQRATYARAKAAEIEDLHALAQRHMDEFEAIMRRIDVLEAETYEDAYADDRSKEWREERREMNKLERD